MYLEYCIRKMLYLILFGNSHSRPNKKNRKRERNIKIEDEKLEVIIETRSRETDVRERDKERV